MNKIILMIAINLFLMTSFCYANDGVFYVKGNTLIPLQETQIELRKEILKFHIKDFQWMDVDVDFTFYNPGNAKTVTVGFVTPPASGDVNEGEENHPQIKNFTVNVNGKNLKYKIQRMKDTAFQSKDLKIDGYDFVYHFPVTFKKGLNKVRHTYRFRGGGSVELQRDFDYQITTGKRWANKQIDDFQLQIHADRGIFFIPLSFNKDGSPTDWKIVGKGSMSEPKTLFMSETPNSRLVQINEGYISLTEKNFKPSQDILIGEYNWNIGWHKFMCIDENDCYKPEEFVTNEYQFFTVNPSEYIGVDDLQMFNKRSLKIIRNFPYAIRGYDFSTNMLRDFYSKYFWYKPDANLKLSDIKLTKDEEVFIAKVLEAEKKKK